MTKKIILATDHAGFALKEVVKDHLKDYEVEDKGAHSLDEKDDYPDFIIPAAKQVAQEGCLGIIFGGSGQGEAIAANRVKGVRAALYYGGDKEILTLSKTHNNANILSLGARKLSTQEALEAIDLWLSTEFGGEQRHQRRIEKLDV